MPAVVYLEYNSSISISNKLIIKKFLDTDIQWRKFILYNRLSTEYLDNNIFYEYNNIKYDMVSGPTSDGDISKIVNDIRNGYSKFSLDLLDKTYYVKRNGTAYPEQITFLTTKSLESIIINKYEIL